MATLPRHSAVPTGALQPHCSRTTTRLSHPGLRPAECPDTRTTLPLPYHPGQYGRRPPTTTQPTATRRHMATVASRPQTIRPVAIPTEIPGPETRTRLASRNTRAPRSNDGIPARGTGPHNTDRTRNTMLGNSWHVPTAMWILFLLLLQPAFGIPPPTQRVRRGSLGTMVDLWLHNPRPWGPPPRASETLHMPQNDWQDHLTWAQHHATSLQQPQHCDATILWAIAMQRTIPQLPQLQHNVLLDIADLRDDLTTDTLAWFEQLPPHCQRAYRQPKMITQVPLMTHLLHLLNYPQAQLLHEELSLGFDLLGPLRPGVNWHIRHDHKYLDPCDLDELRSFNKAYIQRKLQQHKIDDHWTLMATEIAGEVAQGRMAGPFEAPTHWTSRTVPLHLFPHTSRLLPIPHRDPIVAVAFSIQQTGSDGKPKVRRGEDWRRSGHNQTCSMHDQPYHHTPDHYIQCARQYHDDSHPLHVWGHDHDGAYRQLPLAQPEVAYVLLITPDGPTLWHHHVLLFGSAASVWGYNRFGDALTALARVLTLTPALHYVDDYGAIQPNHIATSSFSSFSKLNSLLGFHMKTSKEQPPAPSHKIQGVYIDLSATHATLRPCPDRVRTLSHTLSQCLEQGSMSNDTARRTAGKCNSVTPVRPSRAICVSRPIPQSTQHFRPD